MTDRELLELAAKAAGLQVKGWVGDKLSYFDPTTDWVGFGDWNPLEDDGDALRLAVKLGIQIHFEGGNGEDSAVWADEVMLWAYGDRPSATRLAIVQAAAEIGRFMQSKENQ